MFTISELKQPLRIVIPLLMYSSGNPPLQLRQCEIRCEEMLHEGYLICTSANITSVESTQNDGACVAEVPIDEEHRCVTTPKESRLK